MSIEGYGFTKKLWSRKKLKKIIKYWKKSKIRTQIIFTYILILLLSFVMTFSMIWAVNNKYTKEEIGKAGVQTVSALHVLQHLLYHS